MHSLYSKLFLKPVIIIATIFLLSGCLTSIESTVEPIGKNLNRHNLSNGMVVDVLLPQSYSESNSYPVLLLNDGEQIFSQGGWDMKTLLKTMTEGGQIIPIIAVAIHNQGMRNNWYIPYDDSWVRNNWGPYTPQAEDYADTIFEEILPFLEETYSIDLDEVGIVGASLGGLISSWMGVKFPDKIKYSASLSGSLWIADYQIYSDVTKRYDDGQKFWFDIGTREWNYYAPFYSILEEAGAEPGIDNFYYEVPEGTHTVYDWKKRIDMPLKVFFGTDSSPMMENMEVILECIPSQSNPNLKYRRMNPIITLNNGVKFSLAHKASYILESGDTELGEEGSFRNNPTVESKISVAYKKFNEMVTIPMNYCQ